MTEDGQHLTAGIDTGSSAVKVAVVRSRAGDNAEVLSTEVERIRRRNVRDVAPAVFAAACGAAGVEAGELDYVASTGDSDGSTTWPYR